MHSAQRRGSLTSCLRGYVALAVSGGASGTISKELNTEYGADRQANMVAFAVEALKLVREVVTESAKI